MGLPISLVVAVNRNDIIHRTVQKGDFSLCEVVRKTLASAMDIQVGFRGEQILAGQDWLRVGMRVPRILTLHAGTLQHGKDLLAACWL